SKNMLMQYFKNLRLVSVIRALCIAPVLITGCFSGSPSAARIQPGESAVLAGEEPARFAFTPARSGLIQVRSTYRDNLPQTVRYEAVRDYIMDYERGEIRRTPQSRIPDFRTNMLYGIEEFDHSKFPGFGNG